MAELIFFVVMAFPAILGLAEILHTVKKWLLSWGKTGKKILILVLDDENFRGQILSLAYECKWQGASLAKDIFLVDCGLNEKNREECKSLANTAGFKIFGNTEIEEAGKWVKRKA